jgi:CelD/BcsL family acetyltransferase involved in cellulose biosynthesis
VGARVVSAIAELAVEPLAGELPGPNPEWQRLGLACGNPFSTWEWASAWWRHFGEDREQRIVACRDESGELVGILPLYLSSRRPLRTLRFVGHGQANQLGPVCLPGRRGAVASALRAELARGPAWDVFIAERLAADSEWPSQIGGVVTRVESSPTIRFETDDWDEYLSERSSNFRQQARRSERRLAKKYALEFRLAEDPDRLEDDMSTLLALHEMRWASSGGSTSFAGKLSDFHRDVAALALAGGWLRLCFLELDGVARAAIYCFRLGGADWYFQAGRDPAFEEDRIGYVLLNHVIREAVQAGMGEFKLLLGAHEYKARYTNDDAPVETIVLGRSALTRTALRMAVPARNAARRAGRRLGHTTN